MRQYIVLKWQLSVGYHCCRGHDNSHKFYNLGGNGKENVKGISHMRKYEKMNSERISHTMLVLLFD